ncbi:MAG: 50S ribosomal protein L22 [Nanoarchaeota archaeon]|nr:50S ribosomal protein L22 [Nanoarchaeota archaeon]
MTSKENSAMVNGKDMPISTKQSIEICNFIRGKNLLLSKAFLEKVLQKKKAVPFRRFNRDMGHKPGSIGPGRYPQKASKLILQLLESLEVNAQNKGLDTATLYLKTVVPNKGANVWHYGRQRRRRMKLTHIFMLAEEKAGKKEEKKESKKKPEAKK